MGIMKFVGIGVTFLGTLAGFVGPLSAQTDATFAASHFAATHGDPDSDSVYLWLQGGPVIQPDIDTIGANGFASLAKDFSFFVLPYQAQTLSPEKYNTQAITFDEAKIEAALSTKIVNETIEHFKAQGKKVHVISGSYGSFVAIDQLAVYGNTADSYIIIVGRLDMQEGVWTEFAKGNPMGFVDGERAISVTIEEAGMGTGTEVGDRNMMRLAAGLGHKRYTELLTKVDLSNVTYITAARDQQVGHLQDFEIEFLQKQGAAVFTADSGHMDSAGSPEAMAAFTKLFSEN